MEPMKPMEPMQPMKPLEPMKPMRFEQWWPQQFGNPSTSGGQNGIRYAFFPDARRLVIEENGRQAIYDTGDHRIGSVSSQQQNGGRASLTFASQHGPVSLDDLKQVDLASEPDEPARDEPYRSDLQRGRPDSGRHEAQYVSTQIGRAPSPGSGSREPAQVDKQQERSISQNDTARPQGSSQERVVFSEEGRSATIRLLVQGGDLDLDLIEALEDFCRRQKRRVPRS